MEGGEVSDFNKGDRVRVTTKDGRTTFKGVYDRPYPGGDHIRIDGMSGPNSFPMADVYIEKIVEPIPLGYYMNSAGRILLFDGGEKALALANMDGSMTYRAWRAEVYRQEIERGDTVRFADINGKLIDRD